MTDDLSYFSVVRGELVRQLREPLGRVLDVGCGTGAAHALLRQRGAGELVGIEIDPAAGAAAREVYDAVLIGAAEQAVDQLEGTFDTILCYDVLEHLVDPWQLVRRLHALASQVSQLHVSVPNARHLSLAYDVYLRGTFGYTEWGHRDRTHLRWFTPADLERGLRDSGWSPIGHSHTPMPRWRHVLGKATGGRSTQFLVWQWQVLAERVYARGETTGA